MITRTVVFLWALTLAGTANAALHDRGAGLIYDDVLNVTWLQDANYAKTSGYNADGRMNWSTATNWAINLVYHDNVRSIDYSDWRLPTMIDTGDPGCNFANRGTDCGYNVQTYDSDTGTVYSEMGYMYFVNLGLTSRMAATPTGFPGGSYDNTYGIFGDKTVGGQNDVGLIRNLQSAGYWSGLQYMQRLDPVWGESWNFWTDEGYQYSNANSIVLYAWAVRDGDVAAIPEPETYGMFLAGLGLLAFKLRKR